MFKMKTSYYQLLSVALCSIPLIISSQTLALQSTSKSMTGSASVKIDAPMKHRHFTAVGASFNNSFANNLPLVYTTNNGGKNWTLSSALSLPSGQTQGFLNAIFCSNGICTAGGESFDSTFNTNLPLTYTSMDGGSNWTLSSALFLPSGQTQGEIFGINCIGNNCTAVGTSFDNSFANNLPLAYTSHNGGNNWTLSSALSLPAGQTQGFLNSVSCIGSNCTAVGLSFDNSFGNKLPLAYTSNNGGANWTLSPAFFLPQAQGELFSVACTGSICTAVGDSFDSSGNNDVPIAYTSNDGGANWTLSSSFALPSGQTQGSLNGVTCNYNFCIAVGQSFNSSFNNRLPLAYTSNDAGVNWTLAPMFILPSGQTLGVLNGVICSKKTCTVVGETFDSSLNNRFPLTYTSHDGGNNWILSSALSLPSGQTQGELLGVGNRGSCLAPLYRRSVSGSRSMMCGQQFPPVTPTADHSRLKAAYARK